VRKTAHKWFSSGKND